MFSSGGYNGFGGRGCGRGRGRGGYSAARRGGQGWHPAPEVPRAPSPPLGPVLTTISYNELNEDQAPPDAKITGVEDIASYNWIKAKKPTIMVPGMPPKWTPSGRPTQLAEDNPKGTYYRDPNAAYFPSYPMEPVVRSIFEAQVNLEFDPTKIDIFGCGSTLGNLLRFVRNVDTDKPCRFLVEVVGETVFFNRRENSPKEVIMDVRGYGHSFPEAYTTWADVKGSKTHQRIIRYQLGDLNTVVRFEADGYLADKAPVKRTNNSPPNRETDEDSLVSALTGSTISAKTHQDSGTLKLIQGQGSVPQSAVFDLKTRSIKKKYHDTTLADQLPRLWIKQIPFFVLAYHERGLFRPEEVTVHDVKPDIAKWENDNKRDLRKLIALIKKIADFVKATPGRKLEVRYQYGVGLELRKQHGGVTSVLPDKLAARWAGQGERDESTKKGVALKDDSVDGGLNDGSINGGVALDDKIDNDSRFDEGLDDEYDWDKESEKDFTACSPDSCGYCGHCSY